MLIVKSAAKFGTVQLQSGDVFFNNGEAFIEDEAQVAEISKLINSGRVPHLEIVTASSLEAEAKKAVTEAERLQNMLAAVTKGRAVTGATSTTGTPGSKAVVSGN